MNPERSTRPWSQDGTANALREFVSRIRDIDDKMAVLHDALRDIYQEAKARGVNIQALKKIARDANAKQEADTTIGYLKALGMSDGMVERLKAESLDTILFGDNTGFPSDVVSHL